MGIGFVLLFWLALFAVLAATYIFLRFLAKEYYFAKVLKDAFTALSGVFLISVTCLFVFAIVGVCLDYFYPSRIFRKNFGFEPTADVRIIEGSSFWSPLGYSTHLKFQANEETIEKIVSDGFLERNKSIAIENNSAEINNIIKQPQSHYYKKVISFDELLTDKTLAYDKQSQTAYFSYNSAD